MRRNKHVLSLGIFLCGLSFIAPTAYGQGKNGSEQPSTLSPQNLVVCKTFAFANTTIDVTTHGNVIGFESPAGFEHIANGFFGEGYVLCDSSGGNRFDLGASESGFGNATCTCNSTTCNITRNTTDGRFELKQKFTSLSSERAVRIEMSVRNRTAGPLFGVILRRQVDFDIDGIFNNDHAASERDSYFAWNNAATAGEGHMLQLRHISPNQTREAKVTNNVADSTCSPADVAQAAPRLGVDDGGTIQYTLGTINANATKTVTVQYERD